MNKLISVTALIILLFFSYTNMSFAENNAPPVFVEATTVQLATNIEQIMATGTLVAIPGIVVRPEIPGRITRIYFQSGTMVAKDMPLIEINADITKADLVAAQAKLQVEKFNFTRMQTLYKTRVVSKSDFESAQESYHVAQAKVDGYQAKLRQAIITAPFAGKLGLSKVSLGDYINVGQDIVNLQAVDPLKVDFSVPEVLQSVIAVGKQVFLHTDAYPHETFIGVVEAYDSVIDQSNRTLNVRASVPNNNGKLIPGGFVEVILQVGRKQVIRISQTAIVYEAQGTYIYKIIAGKAQKVPVTLGKKGSHDVMVLKGVTAGDTIVTAGQMKLHPGSRVSVVKR